MTDTLYVEIANFQSIRKAKLEIEPGLTVIVGKNNIGKSAIFRAISTALFNKPAEHAIRRGEAASAVKIKYKEHSIAWRRLRNASASSSKVSYWVDGEEYSKMKGNSPAQVKEFFSIYDILVAGNKTSLNFWKQESLPFLMGSSSLQLFEFLSMSSEEGNITEVVKDLKRDMEALKSDVTRCIGALDAISLEISREEERLTHEKEFKLLFSSVVEMQPEFEALKDLELLTSAIAEEESIVERLTSLVAELTSRANLLPQEMGDELASLTSLQLGITDCDTNEKLVSSLDLDVKQLTLKSENMHALLLKMSQYLQDFRAAESLRDSIGNVLREHSAAESLSASISSLHVQLLSTVTEKSSFTVCPLCNQVLPTTAATTTASIQHQHT